MDKYTIVAETYNNYLNSFEYEDNEELMQDELEHIGNLAYDDWKEKQFNA